MRFLILNTDYPEFLHWLYAEQPGLESLPYEQQARARADSLFGVADFYSRNLRALGQEAWDVYSNNLPMQRAWVSEHGGAIAAPVEARQRMRAGLRRVWRWAGNTPLGRVKSILLPLTHRMNVLEWDYAVLEAQIAYWKPTVLLNQAMDSIRADFLRAMKAHVGLLMGQHAATQLPEQEDWSGYDLVISSFPPTLEFFRRRGIRAELSRLGFEPSVLATMPGHTRRWDVSFVGSLSSVHHSRIALLEGLCARFPRIGIWGPTVDHLPRDSSIRPRYMGNAWGKGMYEVLRQSGITINHHGDIAPYANNMRLYEATGVGTLLLTDWKENLHEMFEPGKEVAAYRTAEECGDLVAYYLEHDEEREAIARAGQERTLSEHTYKQRMRELVNLAREYV